MSYINRNIALVPISKVVNAALIDNYATPSDIQRYQHWVARGYQKLINEVLPTKIERAILPVNKAINTANLPCDVETEVGVWVINGNYRVRIYPDTELLSNKEIVRYGTDVCKRCGRPKSICEEMTYEEVTRSVKINDAFYDEVTVKKILPNGDYILEVNVPFYDSVKDEVIFKKESKLIAHFDMDECGHPKDNDINNQRLKEYAPTCWYASCRCSDNRGSITYNIFYESGLIQLSPNFKGDEIYIEYQSSMPRIGGRLMIPKIAFETLVQWTKFKAIEGKKNEALSRQNWFLERYKEERRNMEIILGREGISLDYIGRLINTVAPISVYQYEYPSNTGVYVKPKAKKEHDTTIIDVQVEGDDTFIIANDNI